MNFNVISSIKEFGFTGFIPICELMKDHSVIPESKGVYMVLYTHDTSPVFPARGTGGYFKERDPNVSQNTLQENWVEGAKVIYIGKAGGTSRSSTLKARIKNYLRFGQGKNASHWGGRYIWQLKDSESLQFCWKVLIDEDPRQVEKNLIYDFKNIYHNWPFANLRN
jgi:hypothetical protein